MDEQKAWLIGDSHYLSLQTCNDGYDYTLFDKNYLEIDGGQLDMPEISMDEAKNIILSDFELENKKLQEVDYEELMEITETIEMTNWKHINKNMVNNTSDEKVIQHESNENINYNKTKEVEKWNDVNGNGSNEEKLVAFLDCKYDSFAILQLKSIEETRYERFEPYSYLTEQGKKPEFDHYDVVYANTLAGLGKQISLLDFIFEKFNIDHPNDYRGHSLSVSDVVALKINNEITCHYVDSIGFVEVSEFLPDKNYLRNIEDTVEQNDNCFDGVINNISADDKKISVLEKLKNTDKCKFKSNSKSKEMELE